MKIEHWLLIGIMLMGAYLVWVSHADLVGPIGWFPR